MTIQPSLIINIDLIYNKLNENYLKNIYWDFYKTVISRNDSHGCLSAGRGQETRLRPAEVTRNLSIVMRFLPSVEMTFKLYY